MYDPEEFPDYDTPGSSQSCLLAQESWYHGNVTRLTAETAVLFNGDFLVRDSISEKGEYVLTCRWNGRPLHFQINSTIENGRKMYHFELESFATVVDLINFYVNHCRPITFASKCIISAPVTKPEKKIDCSSPRDIEASYMHILRRDQKTTPVRNTMTLQQKVRLNQANRFHKPVFSKSSHDLCIIDDDSCPPLQHRENLRFRALPVPNRSDSSSQDEDDYDSVDYAAMDEIGNKGSTKSGKSFTLKRDFIKPMSSSCHNLTRTASPSAPNQYVRKPGAKPTPPPVGEKPPLPPRPNDIFNGGLKSAKSIDKNLESENENDYDDVQRSRISRLSSVMNVNTDTEKLKRLSNESSATDYDSLPSDRSMTQRDSGIYGSPSPPHDKNEGFSAPTLFKLKNFLTNSSAKDVAFAITYEDAILFQMIGDEHNFHNALQFLMLPKGAKIRETLSERSRLITLSVILSIVTTKDGERLRAWLDTCKELLNFGNFYGFINVMDAIVSTLMQTRYAVWYSIDAQRQTLFEDLKATRQKLRHFGCPPQYTMVIPMIQPILEIMGGSDNQFLEQDMYVTDNETLFRWIEVCRDWIRKSDDLGIALKSKLGPKQLLENPISLANLRLLIFNHADTQPERYEIAIDRLEDMIQNKRISH
ncbi:unnamed protein product [Caenorhabditis bovis]|uniref:SH2 domain-containing protein n=1 Tax=Caenorhabditis bovis TaxID=2654633 RepID=A0A8S1EIA1_9PELO|nr:unnamed protein product [Caenorhabditis bovis]